MLSFHYLTRIHLASGRGPLQDVPELAIGSGLTHASLGLRLRYQISPLVAPYIGVEYERAFGDTRRFLRAEGENSGGFNLLAGVRFWF